MTRTICQARVLMPSLIASCLLVAVGCSQGSSGGGGGNADALTDGGEATDDAAAVDAAGGGAGDGGGDAAGDAAADTAGDGAASDDAAPLGYGLADADCAKGWQELAEEVVDGALNSAWSGGAAGAGREWVLVGGTQDHSVVYRLHGASWRRDLLPGAGLLWWVHGDSQGRRMAVGAHGRVVRWQVSADPGGAPVDPATLDVFAIPELQADGVPLYGTWFDATMDHAYVVGGDPFAAQGGGVIAKLPLDADAARVEGALQPFTLAEDQRTIFKVWGRSADEVYAVGEGGLIFALEAGAWPQQYGAETDVLVGIHGTASAGPYTVGGRGTGVVIGAVDDGYSLLAGGPDAFVPGLSAVTTLPDGRVLVGGDFGYAAVLGSDGATTCDAENIITTLTLHGAAADEHTAVLVGGSLANPKKLVGTVWTLGDPLPALPDGG